MLFQIFRCELKYWLKNPVYYFYLCILFFPVMISMAGLAGVFGEESVSRTYYANSISELFSISNLFAKLLIFLIPAVTGHSVYRDFKSNIHQILFTYPVTRSEYLSGKFLGSFIPVCILSFMIPAGLFAGTVIPGTDSSLLLSFDLNSYLTIYLLYLLPLSVVISVITFAVVLFSRNIYAGFIGVIVMMIIREALLRLAGISNAALFADPFGSAVFDLYIQNSKNTSYDALLISGRAIWLLVSIIIFTLTVKYFSFQTQASSFYIPFLKNKKLSKKKYFSEGSQRIKFPEVSYRFGFLNYLKTAYEISGVNFRQIIFSGSFLVILITGSLFILIILLQMNSPYEAKIQPRTWVMLGFPLFFFSLLVSLMTFLYSGMLIQSSKISRMNELTDTTPVPDWVLLLSKLFALIRMQKFLLLILMLAGMTVQLVSGYYKFNIGLYLFSLFVIQLPGFIILAMGSLLVQTVLRNQYAGLLVLICLFFLIEKLPDAGIENLAFRFNQDPEPGFVFKYSEMSGYGHSVVPHLIYKSYWFLFSAVLFFLTLLFVERGYVYTFRERLKTAFSRLRNKYKYEFAVTLFAFVVFCIILYSSNNNSTFKAYSSGELDRIAADADARYSHLYKKPQPKIVSAKIDAAIFPEANSFQSTGSYLIVNKTVMKIDTLIICRGQNVYTEYELNRNFSYITKDDTAKTDLLKLDTPINPGDTIKMNFKVSNIPNTPLLKNSFIESIGTFITSEIYPSTGYFLNEKSLDPLDSANLTNHYRSASLDYITLDLTVSTSEDQQAFAPGNLREQRTESGRNYYNYYTEKSTGDFAIVSGEYETAEETSGDTKIKVYYFKGHDDNVKRLLNGVKAAIDYNEKYFGSYPHKSINLIEYSRAHGNFAMSFAGMIPYSESNFVIDMNDSSERSLDLPFLGASHETAHQWWGNFIIPANARGARLITESMAEYISLMTLEKNYGKIKAEFFLKKALDIYLKKRISDEPPESSLIDNSGLNRSYIPYQKGSIALYALQYYIGEEKLNSSLKIFFDSAKNREGSYPTSYEFVKYIDDAVPDSLKYIINDLFETVTFSNCSILNAHSLKTEDGYLTTVELEMSKRTINKDREEDIPVNDYVEINLSGENSLEEKGNVIYSVMHKLSSGKNTISIFSSEKPTSVSAGKLPLFIDNNIDDNFFKIQSN